MGTIISLLIAAFLVVVMLNTKFDGDRTPTPFIVYAGVICLSGWLPAFITLIAFFWLLRALIHDGCVETFDLIKDLFD